MTNLGPIGFLWMVSGLAATWGLYDVVTPTSANSVVGGRDPMPVAVGSEPLGRPDRARMKQQVEAILERPLFSPDRRPLDEEPMFGDGSNQAADVGLTFYGASIAGDQAVALIAAGDAPAEVLGPGAKIAGWTIDAIEPRAVRISRAGETRTLTVDENRKVEGEGASELQEASNVRSIADMPPRIRQRLLARQRRPSQYRIDDDEEEEF